jgi:hypothetical protein
MNSRFHPHIFPATHPSSRSWKRHGLFVDTRGGILELTRANQTNAFRFNLPCGLGLPHGAFWPVRLVEQKRRVIMSEKETTSQGNSEAGIGQAGSRVGEGIVGTLKGINEIEAEIVGVVRNTVSNSFKTLGAVAGEEINVTKDVIKEAIQATEEVGSGLVLSTKSVAKGVIMGVSDVGGDAIGATSQTVMLVVKEAADVGADVSMVVHLRKPHSSRLQNI